MAKAHHAKRTQKASNADAKDAQMPGKPTQKRRKKYAKDAQYPRKKGAKKSRGVHRKILRRSLRDSVFTFTSFGLWKTMSELLYFFD